MLKKRDLNRVVGIGCDLSDKHEQIEQKCSQQNAIRAPRKQRSRSIPSHTFTQMDTPNKSQILQNHSDNMIRSERYSNQQSQFKKSVHLSHNDWLQIDSQYSIRKQQKARKSSIKLQNSISARKSFMEDDPIHGIYSNIDSLISSNLIQKNQRKGTLRQKSRSLSRIVVNPLSHDNQILINNYSQMKQSNDGRKNSKSVMNRDQESNLDQQSLRSEYMSDSSESVHADMDNEIQLQNEPAIQNLESQHNDENDIFRTNMIDAMPEQNNYQRSQIDEMNQMTSLRLDNRAPQANTILNNLNQLDLNQSMIRQKSECLSDDGTLRRFQQFYKEKYNLEQQSGDQNDQAYQKLNEIDTKQEIVKYQLVLICLDIACLLTFLRQSLLVSYQGHTIATVNFILISIFIQVQNFNGNQIKRTFKLSCKEQKNLMVAILILTLFILSTLPDHNLEMLMGSLCLVQALKVLNQHYNNSQDFKLTSQITLIFILINVICSNILLKHVCTEQYTQLNSNFIYSMIMLACNIKYLFTELERQKIQVNQKSQSLIDSENYEAEIWNRIDSELKEFQKVDYQKKNCSVRGQSNDLYQELQEDQYNRLNDENYDQVCSINESINQGQRTSQSGQIESFHQFQLSPQITIGSHRNIKSNSRFNYPLSVNSLFEQQINKILKEKMMVFRVQRQKPQVTRAQTNSDNDQSAFFTGIKKSIERSINIQRNRSHLIPQYNKKMQSKTSKKPKRKINPIHFSEAFFEELPFYSQIDYLYRQQKQNQFPNSSNRHSSGELNTLQSRDHNNFLKAMASNNSHQNIDELQKQNLKNASSISNQPSISQIINKVDLTNKGMIDQPISQICEQSIFSQLNHQSRHVRSYFNQRKNMIRACNSDNEVIHQQRDQWYSSMFKIGSQKNSIMFQSIVLSELQQQMMDLKVFEPYFINNQTRLEFKQQNQNLSIKEILLECTQFQKEQSQKRLYFKVNRNDSLIIHLMNMQSNSSYKLPPSHLIKSYLVNNESQIRSSIMHNLNESLLAENYNDDKQVNKYNVMKSIKEDENMSGSMNSSDQSQMEGFIKRDKYKIKDQYDKNIYDFQSEIDMNKSLSSQSSSCISQNFNSDENISKTEDDLKYEDDRIIYFEFEIFYVEKLKKGQQECQECFILNMKDITYSIRGQKQLSDQIYQQAIEGNYSHSQMTPLNFLTQSTSLIRNKVSQLFNQNQQIILDILEKSQSKRQLASLLPKLEKRLTNQLTSNMKMANGILKMSEDNQQSSSQLWFLNQGQIRRFQILQKKFQSTQIVVYNVVDQFQTFFKTFKKDLIAKNLSVYVAFKNFPAHSIQADWNNLNLILFNIVHNSIKFNYLNGDIIIILSTKRFKNVNDRSSNINDQILQQKMQQSNLSNFTQDLLLDIQIIDSGEGISIERQKLLFKPFSELQQIDGLKQRTKNDNIGLGLAASRQIARELKGDLMIKQSQKGLTILRLRLPIKTITKSIDSSLNIEFTKQKNKQTQNEVIQQKVIKNQNQIQFQSSLMPAYSSKEASSIIDCQIDQDANLGISKIIQLYGQKQNKFSDLVGSFLSTNYYNIYKMQIEYKVDDYQMIDTISSDSFQLFNKKARSCNKSTTQQINKVESQYNPKYLSSHDLKNLSHFKSNSDDSYNLQKNESVIKSQQIEQKELVHRCNAIIQQVQQNMYSQRQLQKCKEMIADQEQSSSLQDPSILSGQYNFNSSNKHNIISSDDSHGFKSNAGSLLMPLKNNKQQINDSGSNFVDESNVHMQDNYLNVQKQYPHDQHLSDSFIESKIPVLVRQRKFKSKQNLKNKLVYSDDPQIQTDLKIKMMINNQNHPVNKHQHLQKSQQFDNNQIQSSHDKSGQNLLRIHDQQQELNQKNKILQSQSKIKDPQPNRENVIKNNMKSIQSQNSSEKKDVKDLLAQQVIQNLIVHDIYVHNEKEQDEISKDLYKISHKDLKRNFIKLQMSPAISNQNYKNNLMNINEQILQSQNNNNIISNNPQGSIKQQIDNHKAQFGNHSTNKNQRQLQSMGSKFGHSNYKLIKDKKRVSQKKVKSLERFEEEKQSFEQLDNDLQILADDCNVQIVQNLSADDNYFLQQLDQQNVHQSLSSIQEDEEIRQSSKQSYSKSPQGNQMIFDSKKGSEIINQSQIQEVVELEESLSLSSHKEQNKRRLFNQHSLGNLIPKQLKVFDRYQSYRNIQNQNQMNANDSQMQPRRIIKKLRPKSNQQLFSKLDIEQIINSQGRECNSLHEQCQCKPMILVVDDNAFNLDIQVCLIQEYLCENYGIQNASALVQQANDGAVAVDLVKQCLEKQCMCRHRVYKLIVMDLQMQQMNGDEASVIINKLIQEENQKRQQQYMHMNGEDVQIYCNIVACTANTTEQWSQQANQSGMVSLINKPLTRQKIQEMLQNWYYNQSDQIFNGLDFE